MTPEQEKEKYPQGDYVKSIFSFSNNEMSLITPWDVQVQIGLVAQKMLDIIINTVVAKRVGIKIIKDTGVEFNTQEGKLYIWQPKNICSTCRDRKAEFSYAKALYCKNCIELLKQQIAAKAPVKTKNKTELKK